MRIIKKVSKPEFKKWLYDLDTDDKNLYDEANNPNMIGIFQLTAGTAKFMVEQIKPSNFDELNACNAFARPGTMDFVPQYIKNRETGKSPYPKQVADILSETHSVCIYQEQTMEVFHKIGGFSMEKCIQGDEKILTNTGWIPIREIVNKKLDVLVFTLNEVSGKKEWKEIKNYFNNGKKELIEIELENGSFLKCTPDHKVFTSNRGWVEAKLLTENDDLLHYLS